MRDLNPPEALSPHTLRPDTLLPDSLLHGERLLIRTVRLLALDQPCHGLRAHFEQACGCAGETAYRMLQAFVQQLRQHGRRRLGLSIPADPRLTPDEGLILDVFGCAQSEDYRALHERLHGLLGAQPSTALGGAACGVAATLAMNGLMLRPRPTPDAFIPQSWREDVEETALLLAAE